MMTSLTGYLPPSNYNLKLSRQHRGHLHMKEKQKTDPKNLRNILLKLQLYTANTNHPSIPPGSKTCTLGGETSKVVHCEVKP